MSEQRNSVLLVYPAMFSNNPGSFRLKRMMRALHPSHSLVLLTKGPKFAIRKRPWGTLLVTQGGSSYGKKVQKKSSGFGLNEFRSFVGNKLLSPDAGVWWNLKVMKEERFQPYFRTCSSLITSSPPQSVHLLGKSLSKKYKLKWLMDMRDGWLDEPLKKSLFFLKAFETYQERTCFENSDLILTNTPAWQKQILKRYPKFQYKSETLTNVVDGFLEEACETNIQCSLSKKESYLLYAGSFRLSDKRRTASSLLAPLLKSMKHSPCKKVLLLGGLSKEDEKEIEEFQSLYAGEIFIETQAGVSRQSLGSYMSQASGLLISSHSQCALPSKFFDYLATKRPILCFSTKGASLDFFSRGLSDVYSVDQKEPDQTILASFLTACELKSFKRRPLSPQYKEDFFAQKMRGFL